MKFYSLGVQSFETDFSYSSQNIHSLLQRGSHLRDRSLFMPDGGLEKP